MQSNEYEVILAIVNAGFADDVMSASKAAGASGGTIINARGTAKKEAEKLFNIVIQSEKEVVLMIVKKEISSEVLHNIYKQVGLKTPGQGIAFTIPVDEVVGIGAFTQNKEIKK